MDLIETSRAPLVNMLKSEKDDDEVALGYARKQMSGSSHCVLAGLVVTGGPEGAWAIIRGPMTFATRCVRRGSARPTSAVDTLKIWVCVAIRAEARLGWLRVQIVQVRAGLQRGFAVSVVARHARG